MVITRNYRLMTFISIFFMSLMSFINLSFSKDDETVIIINNSSSMAQTLGRGTKIGFVKQGLNKAIKKFEGRFKTAIIQTSGEGNKNCKPSIVTKLTKINQANMASLTGKIKSGGRRSLLRALDRASGLFTTNAKNKSIVLITDGIDQCGGDPCVWSKNYRNQGVATRIHVIGVKVANKEKAGLRCIAGFTRGNYRDVSGNNSILSAVYGVFNAASIDGHLKSESEPKLDQLSTKPTTAKSKTNINKKNNKNNITVPVKHNVISSNRVTFKNEPKIYYPLKDNSKTKTKFNFNKKSAKNNEDQPSSDNTYEVASLLVKPIKRPKNIPQLQTSTNTLPIKRKVPDDIEKKHSKSNSNNSNKQNASMEKPVDSMQDDSNTKKVEQSIIQQKDTTPLKLNKRLSSSENDDQNQEKKNVARLSSNSGDKAKPDENKKSLNAAQPILSTKDSKTNDTASKKQDQVAKVAKGTVDLYAQIIKSSPPMKRNIKWKIRKIGAGINNLITSDNGRNLELEPGVYEAEATLDKASAKTSFQVIANQRSVGTVILNAGGILFNASLAGKSEIEASLVNLKVTRKADNNSNANYLLVSKSLPKRIVYLGPGIYDILGSIGEESDIKSSVTILPGKAISATLNFMESLKFASKTANVNAKVIKAGKEITGDTKVNWQLSNSSGMVHKSSKTNFSLYLKAGKYRLTVKMANGQSLVKLFEIANGETKNLNLTAK